MHSTPLTTSRSEAVKGAQPIGHNNPQRPPFGLATERISGTSFTAPRHQNQQVWLYRITPSLVKTSDFESLPSNFTLQDPALTRADLTPNTYLWPQFQIPIGGDFVTSQHLLAENGEATMKTGCAYTLYSATCSMPPQTAYFNSDGDDLIIPQAGTLDIQTELGHLLVRNNEICVIPRGIRYRVTLPDGHARGYICTLFQGHFQLPELGAIGSTGLANVRDFQIPTAAYEGHVDAVSGKAVPNVSGQNWNIITRFNRRIWGAAQDHTPFDVVAWNGTYYPYKYDLARFSVLGSVLFDHPDPAIFTVLTAPSNRAPGHAVVDLAIIPPRWAVMEDTYYLPYYHRNSCAEFAGMVIRDQEPGSSWVGEGEFKPLGAMLINSMVTHGAPKEAHEAAMVRDTKPEKIDDAPFFVFLLETEQMMRVTEWGQMRAGKVSLGGWRKDAKL